MIVLSTRISRKGGVRHLARHLLDKPHENDRIEVLSGDRQALDDAQALASVKGCRYSVRHLSVSPERDMTPAHLSDFLQAIDAEFGIGRDRPRLVVRHIRSCPMDWCSWISQPSVISGRVGLFKTNLKDTTDDRRYDEPALTR